METRLVQQRISDVTRSIEHFKPYSGVTPIVLVPDRRSSLSCCLIIPSDPHVILQKWGSDITGDLEEDSAAGKLEKKWATTVSSSSSTAPSSSLPESGGAASSPAPKGVRVVSSSPDSSLLAVSRRQRHLEGFRCLPSCYRVAYLVTRQTTTYNATIRNVPTADDVKVGISVALVFSIRRARDFVYKLGAQHMDELLRAATEEAIRSLARETKIGDLYELRGAANMRILDDLNKKFEEFGVVFTMCAVTDVSMPKELSDSLQNSTLYEGKIAEEERRREYVMNQVMNRAAKARLELDLRNSLLARQMEAAKRQTEIRTEKSLIEAERMKEVAILKSEEEAYERLLKAQTEVHTAAAGIEKLAVGKRQKAETRCEAEKLEATMKSKTMQIRSSAAVEKARNESLARKAEADAEEIVSSMVLERRRYDLEIDRLTAVEKLAGKSRLMLSGKTGEMLMSSVLGAAKMRKAGVPSSSRPAKSP